MEQKKEILDLKTGDFALTYASDSSSAAHLESVRDEQPHAPKSH